MLDLGVFLEQREASLHTVLIGRVDFLLELLTVAHRMVHVVINCASSAFILSQVPLVMTHFEHDFTLYLLTKYETVLEMRITCFKKLTSVETVVLVWIVRECSLLLKGTVSIQITIVILSSDCSRGSHFFLSLYHLALILFYDLNNQFSCSSLIAFSNM